MEDIQKQKQFIIERAKGISLQKIAEKLEVSKRTLVNWSKNFREEVLFQRQLEEDHLVEMVILDQRNKTEVLEEQWAKLKKEIERRNLKLMSTHQVFDQFSKYSALLKENAASNETEFLELPPSEEKESLRKLLFDDSQDVL